MIEKARPVTKQVKRLAYKSNKLGSLDTSMKSTSLGTTVRTPLISEKLRMSINHAETFDLNNKNSSQMYATYTDDFFNGKVCTTLTYIELKTPRENVENTSLFRASINLPREVPNQRVTINFLNTLGARMFLLGQGK